MNTVLLNNLTDGINSEEFKKSWENNLFIRETLYNTLKSLKSQVQGVKEIDFTIANHYAMLAYREGKKAAFDSIMDILDIKE